MNNALFPLFCRQRMRHKLCTVFVFLNHQIECGEQWFLVYHTFHYHLTTSTAVVLQNSCHPNDVFVVPSPPLHSASSIIISLAANRLCHRNTIARGTDKSPNAFINISHVFAALNPALQQNFNAARCSKIIFLW